MGKLVSLGQLERSGERQPKPAWAIVELVQHLVEGLMKFPRREGLAYVLRRIREEPGMSTASAIAVTGEESLARFPLPGDHPSRYAVRLSVLGPLGNASRVV